MSEITRATLVEELSIKGRKDEVAVIENITDSDFNKIAIYVRGKFSAQAKVIEFSF